MKAAWLNYWRQPKFRAFALANHPGNVEKFYSSSFYKWVEIVVPLLIQDVIIVE